MKGTTKIPLSVGGPWKAGGHDYSVTVWCDGTNVYSGTTPGVDIMPTRYEDFVVSRTMFRASVNSGWTVESGSLLLTSNNAVGPLGVSKVILSKKALGAPAALLTL